MNQNKPEPSEMEDLITGWTKSVTDFWSGITQMWMPQQAAQEPASPMSATSSVQSSLDNAIRNWQAVSTVMSAPGSVESLLKSAGAMPEMLARMAQHTLNGYFQLQEKWIDRLGRIHDSVDAYSFDRLDENMFRAWIEMYETEFQRFYQIPQLGLTRTYQEKLNQVMDKFNIYQATLSEFFRVLTLPFNHSAAVMQEKLGEMAEKGALPDDSQKYYQMWIKILEGHFMKLFQSSEYTQILANTLNAISEFTSARDAVIQDMMSGLPIPTRKEIDDLEKELYELKKRIRRIEKERQPFPKGVTP